jgi:hypothetical protein
MKRATSAIEKAPASFRACSRPVPRSGTVSSCIGDEMKPSRYSFDPTCTLSSLSAANKNVDWLLPDTSWWNWPILETCDRALEWLFFGATKAPTDIRAQRRRENKMDGWILLIISCRFLVLLEGEFLWRMLASVSLELLLYCYGNRQHSNSIASVVVCFLVFMLPS